MTFNGDAKLSLATNRYRLLFSLPRMRSIVVFLVSLPTILSSIAYLIRDPTVVSATAGIGLGLSSFTLASFASETFSSRLLLQGDPILDSRRLLGLSVVASLIWGISLDTGAAVDRAFHTSIFVPSSLYGLALIGALRSIVIPSLSSRTRLRLYSSMILQPILSAMLSWPFLRYGAAEAISFILSLVILSIAALLFVSIVDRSILAKTGKVGLPLFRAFVLNWVEDQYEPLESILDEMGYEKDVKLSTLRFTTGDQETLVVVPTIHPGPIKNIGSSELTHRIASSWPSKANVMVCVPHGTSGHELDLTSHIEMEKALRTFVDLADAPSTESNLATKFIRTQRGMAKASCQIFGKTALITLTLSPLAMEDIPQQIGERVESIVDEMGLKAVVVDAHNSCTDETATLDENVLLDLIEATRESLRLCLSSETSTFEIGSAGTEIRGYSVYDGIGPDGVRVFVIRTVGQTVSYIVIDGNNMVKGLREEILSLVKKLGVDDGEVLTTDTHMVSALSPGRRGYHPIGEAIDRSVITSSVDDALRHALANIGAGKVSSVEAKRKLRVLGMDFVETVGALVDSSLRRAKRLALAIIAPSCVLSAITFVILLV